MRNAGYDVQVKLNTSYEILQAEYDRLTAIAIESAPQMTADEFNTWVGLPTDNVAIANQGGNNPATKQPQKRLEVLASQDLTPQHTLARSKADPEPRECIWLNIGNIRQNEGSTEQPNSEVFTDQGFRFIQANTRSCIAINLSSYYAKQPYERLEAAQDKDFCIMAKPRVNIHKQPSEVLETTQGESLAIPISPKLEPRLNSVNQRQNKGYSDQQNSEDLTRQAFESIRLKSSYWIDRSALGQKLEATQVQALRNAEDGVRWLKKWASNLQAFAEGFAEGGQVKQLSRSPQVIALDRYRYPQAA